MAVAVLLVVLLGYLGLSVIVADRLTRPARNPLVGTPAEYGLSFELVELRSRLDGVQLRGWWIPAEGSDRAIIILHGRNDNRTARNGSLLEQSVALVHAGYNVFAYDSRAHGESEGVRYSLGVLEQWDVQVAVDEVLSRGIPAGRIGLLGHSMGASTALLAAPELTSVAAVVADSPYARVTDLLDVELPRASGLPRFFNPGILQMGKLFFGIDLNLAAPEDVITRVPPRQILLIHSETDELIPVEHSYRLWRLIGSPPGALWTVSGPLHDDAYISQPEEYLARITAFFDGVMPLQPVTADR